MDQSPRQVPRGALAGEGDQRSRLAEHTRATFRPVRSRRHHRQRGSHLSRVARVAPSDADASVLSRSSVSSSVLPRFCPRLGLEREVFEGYRAPDDAVGLGERVRDRRGERGRARRFRGPDELAANGGEAGDGRMSRGLIERTQGARGRGTHSLTRKYALSVLRSRVRCETGNRSRSGTTAPIVDRRPRGREQ